MLTPKIKKILAVVYILALVSGGLYVRSVVTEKNVKVEEKENDQKSEEIKPVTASLIVREGAKVQEFSATLKNIDTVLDLLEEVRDEQSLRFEKIMYNYGVEIDQVNGVIAPEGYIWKVLSNGKDITFEIHTTKLGDNAKYELVLSKE